MAEQSFNTDPHESSPTLEQQAAALDAAAAERAAKERPEGRPDWLPEGFNDVASFVKSQQDGRAEITRLQQELAAFKKGEKKEEQPNPADNQQQPPKTEDAKPEKTAEQIAEEAKEDPNAAAREVVEKAGLDTSAYEQEFAETGDISAENREKIAEALKGQFGDAAKALVDQFVEGQKAVRENVRASVFAEVGGQDKYTEMVEWARTGLSDAEKAAFNAAVDGPDLNAKLLAVRGLKASYEKVNGRAPNLVQGSNEKPQGVMPFRSPQEMKEAMHDPKYKSDEAYRNAVIQRVILSNF